MKHTLITCLILLISQLSQAQKMSIQDRLAKLEQQSQSQPTNNAADSVILIQQLQTQIAQLQGTIEEQNFQINAIQERQKVLYVDIDSRLAAMEQTGLPQTPNNEALVDGSITTADPNVTVDLGTPQLGTPTRELTAAELGTPTIQAPDVRESVDAQLSTNTMNQADLNAQTEVSNPAVEQAYQAAFAQLKAGRFNESARAFENFIQQNPSHQLTDNAYYWLGESYYVTRNYPLALAAFQSLAQDFPLSSKLADSLLKIGYTYHELEDFPQAQQALNRVVESFPNQSVSRLAQNRLNLLVREGKIN